jgi:hypothetical protein
MAPGNAGSMRRVMYIAFIKYKVRRESLRTGFSFIYDRKHKKNRTTNNSK